jgi:ribonuclease HI
VPGPGGYAATVVPAGGEVRTVAGGWPVATANVMELWAVIAGLRALRRRSAVTIYTSSKYVFDGATRWMADWERRHWRTQQGHPVKNREIWEELGHVMGDHDVHWAFRPAREANEHSVTAATTARQEAERQAAQAQGTTAATG